MSILCLVCCIAVWVTLTWLIICEAALINLFRKLTIHMRCAAAVLAQSGLGMMHQHKLKIWNLYMLEDYGNNGLLCACTKHTHTHTHTHKHTQTATTLGQSQRSL